MNDAEKIAMLLAALELLVDDTMRYFGTGCQPKYLDAAVIKARAAIAKAKS